MNQTVGNVSNFMTQIVYASFKILTNSLMAKIMKKMRLIIQKNKYETIEKKEENTSLPSALEYTPRKTSTPR